MFWMQWEWRSSSLKFNNMGQRQSYWNQSGAMFHSLNIEFTRRNLMSMLFLEPGWGLPACGCCSNERGWITGWNQGLLLPSLRSGVWASFQVWSVGCCDDTMCVGRIPGCSRKSLYHPETRSCNIPHFPAYICFTVLLLIANIDNTLPLQAISKCGGLFYCYSTHLTYVGFKPLYFSFYVPFMWNTWCISFPCYKALCWISCVKGIYYYH